MWSLGCIAYELITGSPLFPAHDENELLEYITVTIGRLPKHMLESCKKYKQFYKKTNNFLSNYNHELIRSKESCLGKSISEGSQPVGSLLRNKTTN
jgi:serine/threonine protein kinase